MNCSIRTTDFGSFSDHSIQTLDMVLQDHLSRSAVSEIRLFVCLLKSIVFISFMAIELHILSGYKDLQYPYSVGFLVFTLTFQGSEEFLVIIFYIFILLFLFKSG